MNMVRSYHLLLLLTVAIIVVVLYVGTDYNPIAMIGTGRLGAKCKAGYNKCNTLRQASSVQGDVDLRVIVITYNRPKSLLRLLQSLNEAVYYGDSVNIDIWIDRSTDKDIIHEETYKLARNFTFRHGGCVVHNHTRHVGIYGQWFNTWFPSDASSEIAVILEDDMKVSPHFYRWLKMVHKKYDRYEKINGYSLQGISIKHGGGSGFLEAPANQTVFLYPIIGTWGFSPRKKNWVDFLDWYSNAAHNSSFVPLVPGILPSIWYEMFLKEGKTDGMWEMWHIYYAWHHHEFTLYSNHRGHAGLAINWREKGLHYPGTPQKQPDPLLTEWRPEFEHLPDHPVCLDVHSVVVDCA